MPPRISYRWRSDILPRRLINRDEVLVSLPHFLPDPFDLHDVVGLLKRPMLLSILDDPICIGTTYALELHQLLSRGGIDVYPLNRRLALLRLCVGVR